MSAFIVVIAAFCLNAMTVGPMKSLGVLFIEFEWELNASVGQASLVTSLIYGAFFLSGPIASILANRFGYRRTILLGSTLSSAAAIGCSFFSSITPVHVASIIIGCGSGLVTVPTMALLGIRFKERRSFVNNVVTCGSSLAAIALSPLVQLWIDAYGWRGAFLLLGGIYLNGLPCCLVMITRKSNKEIAPTKRKLLDIGLLKSITFPVYAIACGCDMSAMVCTTVYLVRFAQSINVGNYAAAALSSVISIVDLILRPISGYITTLTHIGPIPIRRSYYFSGIACLQAVVVSMFPLTDNIYAILAVTVAYSICLGGRGAMTVTLLSDFFGTDKLVSSLGLRAVVVGVFSAATPPLIGKVVDKTGSYHAIFFVSAALSVVSACLVILVQKLVSRNEKLMQRNAPTAIATATLELHNQQEVVDH